MAGFLREKRFALIALLVIMSGVPLCAQVNQRPSPGQTPDVTGKALITKERADLEAALAPALGGVKRYTIEEFMDTEKVGGGSFTHDEKAILFHSNRSGIFNVYRMPLAGGTPRRLTDSKKESTFIVSAFPNDDRFLYTYDKGGNENDHLYLRGPDGKETDLTPGEKTKARFLTWSHDRKSFFFATNERDPKFFDVYEMTVADLKRALVYQNDEGFEFAAISSDKRFIAFDKPGVSTADSDVYLYDVESRKMKHLTPHEGEMANSAQAFAPGTAQLYYLTNRDSEFSWLARYDPATDRHETVEKASWDIVATYFSRQGKYRLVSINEDARTRVKIYETATGETVPLPDLPHGDITGVRFADSEEKIAFYHNGSRSPSNLYLL